MSKNRVDVKVMSALVSALVIVLACGDTTAPAERFCPLLGLVEDWSDHYAQLAGYLRLNNLEPPTAKLEGLSEGEP